MKTQFKKVQALMERAKKSPIFSVKPTLEALADEQLKLMAMMAAKIKDLEDQLNQQQERSI